MSVWIGLLWAVGTLEVLAIVLLLANRTTPKWRPKEKLNAVAVVLNILIVAGGVGVAVYAYFETKRQADIADDRSKIDQRGQLVADNWIVNRLDNNGQTPVASFVLSNIGRTPAYMLHGTYEAAASADLPERFTGQPRRLPSFPGIIMPSQKSSIVISEHLSPIDANAVRDGTLFFYLRIIVWYRDIFGTRYELRATAKYGKIIDLKGDAGFGVEFPEVDLPKELWKVIPKEFVSLRQYNSHKRIED
jgi:hypothetical protein